MKWPPRKWQPGVSRKNKCPFCARGERFTAAVGIHIIFPQSHPSFPRGKPSRMDASQNPPNRSLKLFFCRGSVSFWGSGGHHIFFNMRTSLCQRWGFTSTWGAQQGVGWSVDSRLERVPRDRGWNMVECHEQSAGNWSVSWIKGANHIKGILHTIYAHKKWMIQCYCCWFADVGWSICLFEVDEPPVGHMSALGWFRTMWAPLLGKCQGICGQGWVFLVVSWWFREVTDAYLKPS